MDHTYWKIKMRYCYYIVSMGAILNVITLIRDTEENGASFGFNVDPSIIDYADIAYCYGPGSVYGPMPYLFWNPSIVPGWEPIIERPGYAVGPETIIDWSTVTFMVSSGLYTQELADQIKGTPAAIPTGSGIAEGNPAFGGKLFWQENPPLMDGNCPQDEDSPLAWPIKIFTRPHTKEELTAAGMWPEPA